MSPKKENVTVVVPTLDEEEAIGMVIDELREEDFENVLVVDGHSSDRTVEVARERGAKAIYQEGEGKAMALKTAIDKVDTPFILVMDGDYTYPAEDAPKLLERGKNHVHVVGNRDRGNIPWLHRLGNFGITLVFNLLMETSFEDPLSGMYLLRTEEARKLEFPWEGFECEITICAQLRGESAEVPIGYRKRVGKKKLSGIKELAKILRASFPLSRRYGDPSVPRLIAGAIISALGVAAASIVALPTYFPWRDRE